ncbi:fimbria/pilus outer membrane usher protein [Herbaspirillum sp. RV1423]|uniref:fimbria/pilus outer membrane usher protein n=1 Tax=Herbaspirillum sp. RV1423 TaxID=1443993 RepID=UPI0004B99047|nr:fimbria/pilus outer membrane usher protein [Herbaspirillum sp. RV1423]
MKHNSLPFKHQLLGHLVLAAVASMQSYSVSAANTEKKPPALAQAEFNNQFLQNKQGAPSIDLSRFAKGNPVLAGTYRADIYVNENWIGRNDVLFRNMDSNADDARFCATRSFLEMAGVDFQKLSPEAITALGSTAANSCLQIEDLIPGASASFDSSDLRLNISIPQIAVSRHARGYINPEFWDRGVNAGILGYNFNAYRTSSPGAPSNTSMYLGLNGGINLGDWRFRNTSSVTRQADAKMRYQSIASYLQREIIPLKSQLTIGDTFTSGQFFDSFSFRGVRMASDERMLPDSQVGYAPVVRGVAKTNAKVSIRQGGNIIYETTVAPGQFEINDLNPTGYGGDLDVTITEADGSRSSFSVPYASVAQMLRPGMSRYSVNAGRTRDVGRSQVNFVQGTYERGISNDVTLFAGGLIANDYLSVVGGGAFNTEIGAFSASVTHSHANLSDQETRSGQSYRADYSKLLKDTGTNFSLAAYRYSSNGFMRLQDFLAAKNAAASGSSFNLVDRQRAQLQLMVSQTLGENNGYFYMSGSTQNYWNRPGSSTQYQAGYNNNWRTISYNFSVQRQKDLTSGAVDTQYYASASFPLGKEVQSPRLNNSVQRDSRGGTTLQSSLTGTLGDDNAFSYGVSGSKNSSSSGAFINGQYRSPYATIGGGYGYASGGSSQMSAQISGAVVAHPGGITLAQSIGDTIGIVEAPDAEGAAVNTPGVRIDGRGYAVVPYLTPYRINEVAIDPKGMSTDVELAVTSQRVAPHSGAVVMMKYPTVSGRSILIHAKMPNGDAVPFGAEALDAEGNQVGMAGQGGVVFVRTVAADSGKLTLRWGAAAKDQCTLSYDLPPRSKDAKGMVFDTTEARCEAGGQLAARKKSVEVIGKNTDPDPAILR